MDYSLDLSLDRSNFHEFSPDSLSFKNKKEAVMEDGGKKEGIYKGLVDDKRGVLLENNKRILKLI